MKIIKIISLIFFFACIFSTQKAHSVGQITNIARNRDSVGKFEKFEITFDLTSSYDNPYYYFDADDTPANYPNRNSPYGVDGVTVDAHFTSPSDKEIVVPAFWYVPYKNERRGNIEVLGINGNGKWMARFAPEETGSYQYSIIAQDRNGTTQSEIKIFTVTSSSKKGFVRASSRDPRFFEFNNGENYLPIGGDGTFMGTAGSYYYDDTFKNWKDHGINFTRIWDQNDGYNLALEGTYPAWDPPSHEWTTGKAAIINNGLQGVGAPHSGKRSGMFDSTKDPAGGRRTAGHLQRVVVEAGKEYKLSGYIKTDGLDGQAFLAVGAQTVDNLGTSTIRTDAVSGTTDWQLRERTFTPNGPVITIWAGAANATGRAQFDDIVLEPTSGEKYNVLTDPGFEERYAKDDRDVNNSPEQGPERDPNDPDVVSTLPLGTEMNQNAAFQIDKIVESAENNGIYIQLCSHDDVYWTWDETVHNERYDAWARRYHITDLATNTEYLNYWKRNLRYRVARWGYSTSVFAWERWNEHGTINSGDPMYRFYEKYTEYQRNLDTYQHLRTTSQGSQTYSVSFWAANMMNVVNYHDYLTLEFDHPQFGIGEDREVVDNNDVIKTIAILANCLRYSEGCGGLGIGIGPGELMKPLIWGEIGVLQYNWNRHHPNMSGEGGAVFAHNVVWAGLFSPLGMSPVNWTDGGQEEAQLDASLAASKFFNGVDYAGENWDHLASSGLGGHDGQIASSHNDLQALSLRSANKEEAYIWIHNKVNTWNNYQNAQPLNGSVTIPDLKNQEYQIEWWDTYTGQVIKNERKMPDEQGNLSLSVEGVRTDLAIKILGSGAAPDICPSEANYISFPNTCRDSCWHLLNPQQVCEQITSQGCDCGANKCWDGFTCVSDGDISYGISELIILIKKWGLEGPIGDIDSNSKVDIDDLIILVRNWQN